MPENKINILSTRPLKAAWIDEANASGIQIDELSFIETEMIRSVEVQQEIENAFILSTTVVFTSMNAVESVIEELDERQPDWTIYCIGHRTKEHVAKYFGEGSIAGTADSAKELARLIVENEQGDEVIFFCGDQRRDELPVLLRKNDIEVTEIVVYQTVQTPRAVKKEYNGILFFSPSAVESFFSLNRLKNGTTLFAIGETTASTIKKFTNNKIIISREPGKENLLREAIEYFS